MKLIDDIKITKKGRYALFCAGEFLFSVDEESLVRHGLQKGIQLSDADIDVLRKETDYQKAREKAFTYLSIRDYGENELYKKLCAMFDEHTSASAVSRMKELGLLDDDKFAARIYEEYLLKNKSLREIRYKMLQKGLAKEVIEKTLESYETDETDTIRDIIEKSYLSKLQKENGYRKVYSALLTKGFRSSDIKKALNQFEFTGEEEYE